MNKDYFDIKNEYFLNFLNDLFGINKSKNWDEIAKNVTLEKVKRTYRVFAELYPQNYDYFSELEKLKDTFSTLHYGNIKARKIIDEVVRFSLYSDKIIVFHPIQNPSITNQTLDPRKNPKLWLQDFLDSLYFYIVIQKWVKEGIVKLIVNPCFYDFKVREKLLKISYDRLNKIDKEIYIKLEEHTFHENLAEILYPQFKGKNKDLIIEGLLKMKQPYFSTEEAEKMSEYIIKAEDNINPLNKKLNIPISTGTINTTRGGGSLETMLLISEKSNANIYTPSQGNWRQITDLHKDDFWSKTNHLYSKLPLNFLNNVDTNFALELRKEEKLSGVRQQLKKIYSELNNVKIEDLQDKKIKELQEGFIEEVRKAEAEWLDIKKQADIARKYWFMANLGIPLVQNNISLLPIALGSMAWLYTNEKSAVEKQKTQRQKNSISVFVDLKNQQPNFFTTLKNSLL